jgi:hypothetical protein
MRLRGILWLVAAASQPFAFVGLSAQRAAVMAIGGAATCSACRIDLSPVFTVRDSSLSTANEASLAVDAHRRVFIQDMKTKQYFMYDERGRRIGAVGGVGRGPGEFEATVSAKADRFDTLKVSDPAQRRLSVFAPDSRKHVRDMVLESRLGIREGDWLLRDDGALIASLPNAADPVDRLVLIDGNGRLARRIGPPADSQVASATLAPARDSGYFWRARVTDDRYVIERWTMAGTLAAVLRRDQSWWVPGPTGAPRPAVARAGALKIESIREDSSGALWVVLVVPNESYWRSRTPNSKGGEVRPDQPPALRPYSYVVEVLDPHAARPVYSGLPGTYPYALVNQDLAYCPGKEDPDGLIPMTFCKLRLTARSP